MKKNKTIFYMYANGELYDGTRLTRGNFATIMHKVVSFDANATIYVRGLGDKFFDFFQFFAEDLGYKDVTAGEISLNTPDKSFAYVVTAAGEAISLIAKICERNWLHIYDASMIARGDLEGREFLSMVRRLRELGGKGGTLASNAGAIFRKSFGREYDFVFAQDEHADLVRKAYRGGFCYLNPANANRTIERGYTYDVNSLYPYIFSFYPLPYGDGDRVDGYPGEAVLDAAKKRKSMYYIHFLADFGIRPGRVPFVAAEVPGCHFRSEILEDTDGSMVELVMTNIEFGLFSEQYDIRQIEFVDFVVYPCREGIGREFVEEYFALKSRAVGIEREVYKGILNYVTGNFARQTTRYNMMYVDGEWKLLAKQTNDKVPIQIGAAITSYARCRTVWHAQQNYDSYIYSDTDSLHLTAPAECIRISDALGDYKCEEWTDGYYAGKKWYGYKVDGKQELKLAGVPKDWLDEFVSSRDGWSTQSLIEAIQNN